MNRLSTSTFAAATLALATATVSFAAPAQSYGGYYDGNQNYGGNGGYQGAQYDYARVIRVDPVFDNYNTGNAGQRCYERPTYVGDNGYSNNGYSNGGYYDPYGRTSGGTEGGRTAATVVGGVVGALIGSQIGGGSARYATSAIGSMVGGMAGRQIYDQNTRQRVGTVRVCEPVQGNGYYSSGSNGYYNGQYNGDYNGGVTAYNVTYEYAGRTYTTQTAYHPGDRIRVRVDVRPE